MNALSRGVLAGLVATVPMTVAMEVLWRRLPAGQQYPLPPREIIDRVLPEGVARRHGYPLTLLAHFGYGAAVGALFPAIPGERGPRTGAAYGVLVWLASYFGWVPAANILEPAHRHPLRRNFLMIGAHLVWGAALSLAFSRHDGRVRAFAGGQQGRDW